MTFRPNSFDTVIFFGNNLSLAGTPEGARKIMGDLHRMTSNEGLILAETADPHHTNEPAHLKYHRMNKARGLPPGQVRIRVRYKQFATPWFDFLLLSRGELAQVVKGTGWKVIESLNSGGPQYIAVLRKA